MAKFKIDNDGLPQPQDDNQDDEFEIEVEEEGEEEAQASSGDDLEIEEVDDTPEEDRNRRPPDDDDDGPLTDDEISQYSDRVQRRMKRLTWEKHEERRRAEALEREQEPLITYAQKLQQQNQELRKRLTDAGTASLESTSKQLDAELAQAKSDYLKAFEEGDGAAAAEAQAKMADVSARRAIVMQQRERSQASQQQQPQQREQQQQPSQQQPQTRQQQQPTIDPMTQSWVDKNKSWFNQPGYNRMTQYALALDQDAKDQGYDPKDADYWQFIDANMKKAFPDEFKTEDKPRKKPAPVAGASRVDGKNPKKVRLTASQLRVIKRLGITPEGYVRRMKQAEQESEL